MHIENLDGYIALYRELLAKPIWQNSTPEQKTILITLLLMVNHKEHEWEWKGEKYSVKPGQVITSLNKIKEASGKGISLQNVRTALARFEKLEFLTNESTNENRLLTIVNWASYQVANKETNKPLTKPSQTPNKALTTNNNDNNVYNDNNDENEKNDNNDENNKSSSKKFDEAADEYQLASLLANNIREIHEGAKIPDDLNKWALHIDRMIRLDGRKPKHIRSIINWLKTDQFWSANILSTKTLREKYDQLYMKAKAQAESMKTERTTELTPNGQKAVDALEKW